MIWTFIAAESVLHLQLIPSELKNTSHGVKH